MPSRAELPLTFHTLHDSPLVRVREYRCRACRGGPADEETATGNDVVLMRCGAFALHFGRRTVTADVNQAVFFSCGSTYRVSHPAEGGDRGTVFSLAPRVLYDILRELDPADTQRPGQPFPFVSGPCESAVFWRHRELIQRLATAPHRPLEPLWAEVTSLQLVADVLTLAVARRAGPCSPDKSGLRRRRAATDIDHAERAEAAKGYLAQHLGERIALGDVARAVHASPYHLARVFQQRTGHPIHRYLTRLRLRAALERLLGGAEDLTALALELSFSSHSHFAASFRREFGRTPSAVRRRSARARCWDEMSKNLKV